MLRTAQRIVKATWRVSAMLIVAGCSDSPTGLSAGKPTTPLVVSAPVSRSSTGLSLVTTSAVSGAALTEAMHDSFVYVSMPPGSVPSGTNATVLDVATRRSVIVAFADGGFDPVAIAASVGDSLEIEVRREGGVSGVDFAVVPRRRPPVIVRTDPPKGKTDVPLNTQILIVFSEPVDPATLAGAVRLLNGTTVVAGTVTLSASGIDANFAPASPLAPNTTYQLEVSTGVRSVTGAAPDSPTRITFTTGTTIVRAGKLEVTGLPCSIVVTAKDASGRVATSYHGTVHFTATDPAAVLPDDYTFLSADDRGTHSFPLVLSTSGNQTVTATDHANSLTGNETVAVDRSVLSDEALYVTNENSHSVTVYTAGPNCNSLPSATIAGDNTGLVYPDGIAVNGYGQVYVANSDGLFAESINIYAPDVMGNVAPIATITGGTGRSTLNPRGITLEATGQLYVANGNNDIAIYRPGTTGNVNPDATITNDHYGLLTGAEDVAVDASGRVYVSFFDANMILVFAAGATGDAKPVAMIAGTNTGLNLAAGLAVDNTGRLYVANSGKSSITVYNPGADGNATPIATIAGTNTGLNFPKGIALDSAGRLYVANRGSSTITVYAAGASGNVAPIAMIEGDKTGLNFPAFLAFPTAPAAIGRPVATAGPIVFQSGVGIEAINPDGSGRKVLLANTSLFEPAWSPDGTKLAFMRTVDSWASCDIYTARADGSALQRITVPLTQPWCANSPAWSPDGTRIAFSAGPGGCPYRPQCFGQNIYVVNTDGSGERQLFTPSSLPPPTYSMQYEILIHPTWSPDGTKIAFECDPFATGPGPDEFAGVCAGNADGSGARRLVECCPEIPTWSHDGSEIAFQDNDGGLGIGLMNADGTNVRDLITSATQDSIYGEPAWSPDGSRLVLTHGIYTSMSNGTIAADLYVMNRDGTGLQRLTTSGDVRHPTWGFGSRAATTQRLVPPRVTATRHPRPVGTR